MSYKPLLADSLTQVSQPGTLYFRCNICGKFCAARVDDLDREKPSCKQCGSTVRFRSVVQILSLELFGQSLVLPEFPQRQDLKGLGMSDWEGYAVPLATKCNYQNTYFHTEPKFDIVSIDPTLEAQFDFIISTEVFEHVPPPVSRAFENVHRLLKPGGVFIFTVPWVPLGQTTEHFPQLYDYELIERDGRYTLRNVTQAGVVQVFEDLIFHGGPGTTLEMRLFSKSSLIDEFEKAGFHNIRFHQDPYFDYGIYLRHPWSLPMSVREC